MSNPTFYAPRNISKMNETAQSYDFVTFGKTKELLNVVKAAKDGAAVGPAHGKLNYNICGSMQDQRKTNPNFRDAYKTAYGHD